LTPPDFDANYPPIPRFEHIAGIYFYYDSTFDFHDGDRKAVPMKVEG
jgi:hypothetical protein